MTRDEDRDESACAKSGGTGSIDAPASMWRDDSESHATHHTIDDGDDLPARTESTRSPAPGLGRSSRPTPPPPRRDDGTRPRTPDRGRNRAGRSLDEIRRDWTQLGETEPLWAVCVDPTKRRGGWADEAFLSSGAAEIDASIRRLSDLGWRLPDEGRALDFGCGAGRLTYGLSAHFAETVGVDISEPMLAEARRLLGNRAGVSLVVNESADLSTLDSDSFDLVYCDLVLQHMPGSLARGYLSEMVRVLRPGGALVVGVPVRERRTFKGMVFRFAPNPVIRLAQRLILRYPAPMRMHTVPARGLNAFLSAKGCTLLAADEYWAGDHWEHQRHFFVLDAEPA